MHSPKCVLNAGSKAVSLQRTKPTFLRITSTNLQHSKINYAIRNQATEGCITPSRDTNVEAISFCIEIISKSGQQLQRAANNTSDAANATTQGTSHKTKSPASVTIPRHPRDQKRYQGSESGNERHRKRPKSKQGVILRHRASASIQITRENQCTKERTNIENGSGGNNWATKATQ